MNGIIPPGYQAVLIGSSATIAGMSTLTPMEEGTAEGSMMLVCLDFIEFPSSEALAGLEKALRDKGIPSWPGYDYIVYADTSVPSIHLAWQKGMAWMPIIIGLLITTVLPPLLGSLVWLVLPEEVKSLITSIINMGMMMLVVFVMMQLVKPLTAIAKPKRLEEAKT